MTHSFSKDDLIEDLIAVSSISQSGWVDGLEFAGQDPLDGPGTVERINGELYVGHTALTYREDGKRCTPVYPLSRPEEIPDQLVELIRGLIWVPAPPLEHPLKSLGSQADN